MNPGEIEHKVIPKTKQKKSQRQQYKVSLESYSPPKNISKGTESGVQSFQKETNPRELPCSFGKLTRVLECRKPPEGLQRVGRVDGGALLGDLGDLQFWKDNEEHDEPGMGMCAH